MSESPSMNQRIEQLLDQVELLIQHFQQVQRERDQWKQKARSAGEERDELENKYERLHHEYESQRQRFHSLLEQLEGRFEAIRETARRMESDRPS